MVVVTIVVDVVADTGVVDVVSTNAEVVVAVPVAHAAKRTRDHAKTRRGRARRTPSKASQPPGVNGENGDYQELGSAYIDSMPSEVQLGAWVTAILKGPQCSVLCEEIGSEGLFGHLVEQLVGGLYPESALMFLD